MVVLLESCSAIFSAVISGRTSLQCRSPSAAITAWRAGGINAPRTRTNPEISTNPTWFTGPVTNGG